MNTRKPKSEQSRKLISRSMMKSWAERKERQKQLKEAAERQRVEIMRADYERRRKAGLLTHDEWEKERQQREHDRKLQRRYERESEWYGLRSVLRQELVAKKVVSRTRAFILAARYFQKMYLTPREERCITKFIEKLNSNK